MLKDNEPKYLVWNKGAANPFYYFVIRIGGEIKAYVNRCPHQGLLLNTKEKTAPFANGKLTCVQHKAVFDTRTGECVSGVCKGQSMSRIPVVVRGSDICVA